MSTSRCLFSDNSIVKIISTNGVYFMRNENVLSTWTLTWYQRSGVITEVHRCIAFVIRMV